MFDLKIIIPDFNQIDKHHLHSLWFGGTVAEITYENFRFTIAANGIVDVELWENGEIVAESNDKRNTASFFSNMCNYIKNDDELIDLMHRDEMCDRFLKVNYNNWFELSMFYGSQEIDIGEASVIDADMLDEAIKEVASNIPDFIDWAKKEEIV